MDSLISKNLNRIRENIEKIACKIKKASQDINIVAASKTMPIDKILELDSLGGALAVGENRVQELMEKYQPLNNTEWHFIGQLQSNKVKYIIDKVNLIHSVDRLSLIKEIDRQAKSIAKKQDILIEINLSEDDIRGGIKINELDKTLELLSDYDNIEVLGLMAVMPIYTNEYELTQSFKQMNKLYNDMFKHNYVNLKPQYLSMGMSNDYMLAIEYGSNMIRLGSAIFGSR